MKLPNFFQFEPLNDVKKRMGIPREVYGSPLNVAVEKSNGLSGTELDSLTSGDGIDVNFEELTVLSDGTLAFKDSRILVYIRDVHLMNQEQGMPKYHFYNCSALVSMRESGRFERYVISATTDGTFSVRIMEKGMRSRSERANLNVCKNCLNEIHFKGFNSQTWPKRKKEKFVAEFLPKEFFALYPRSLLPTAPRYDSDNAPLNEYPDNWDIISRNAKARAGYKCEKCGVDLSAPNLRAFLQTHHKNGLRNEIGIENLEVLCLKCHASRPLHSHLRNTPGFAEFSRSFRDDQR